jgi:hypothetical protein
MDRDFQAADAHVSKEREFQRSHTEANPQKGEDNYQAWFANQKNTYDAWFNNSKLTYDTHLDLLATQARRSQDHYDAIVTGEREHRAELERVSLQALQNAVETANMVGKQVVRAQENAIETANLRGKDAVRHSQIATDQQWNMEPSEAAGEGALLRELISQPVMSAIQAAVAKAVTDALSNQVPAK